MPKRELKAFDQENYEDMIVILREMQLSIDAISNRYEISERTAYRWLKYAQTDGWDVVKRGCNPTLYSLEVPKCKTA
jgi:transposase